MVVLILQLGKLRPSHFTEVKSLAWAHMACDFMPLWASVSSTKALILLQGDSTGPSSGSLEPRVGRAPRHLSLPYLVSPTLVHREQLPESAYMHQLLGLNLLFLLSQNRVAEFHTELERLPAKDIQTNVYIKHPVSLEQVRGQWEGQV